MTTDGTGSVFSGRSSGSPRLLIRLSFRPLIPISWRDFYLSRPKHCWKGFQGQRSKVKMICVQICECDNGGGIHFDGVTLKFACFMLLSVQCCLDASAPFPVVYLTVLQMTWRRLVLAVLLPSSHVTAVNALSSSSDVIDSITVLMAATSPTVVSQLIEFLRQLVRRDFWILFTHCSLLTIWRQSSWSSLRMNFRWLWSFFNSIM